jgi:hypothetical protein
MNSQEKWLVFKVKCDIEKELLFIIKKYGLKFFPKLNIAKF